MRTSRARTIVENSFELVLTMNLVSTIRMHKQNYEATVDKTERKVYFFIWKNRISRFTYGNRKTWNVKSRVQIEKVRLSQVIRLDKIFPKNQRTENLEILSRNAKKLS